MSEKFIYLPKNTKTNEIDYEHIDYFITDEEYTKREEFELIDGWVWKKFKLQIIEVE